MKHIVLSKPTLATSLKTLVVPINTVLQAYYPGTLQHIILHMIKNILNVSQKEAGDLTGNDFSEIPHSTKLREGICTEASHAHDILSKKISVQGCTLGFHESSW